MSMRKGRGDRCVSAAVQAIALMSVVVSSGMAVAADDDEDYKPPGWMDRMGDSVKETFSGAGKKLGLGKPPAPPVPEAPSGCPTIAVLPGTESQRVMAPGGSGNQSVRYQFSLSNVGRECVLSGNSVTIKVGAEGRVLPGPVGTAGHFDVPIRVAVFTEAPQNATERRPFQVPLSMASGQTSVHPNFVSDRVTVTIPQGHASEYSIKVGFDAGKGGGAAPVEKTKHARRHKPDATQSASQ